MTDTAIKPIWSDGEFLEVSYKQTSNGVHLYTLWFNGTYAGVLGLKRSVHTGAVIHALIQSFLNKHHLTTN